MKVVILCGGRGVRAFPFTEYMPKPMLPVAGSPIIAQIIKNFVRQGFHEFILAAGYRHDILVDYFEGKDIGGSVTVLDTGEDADTGGRIFACRQQVGERFIVTYGDGLSNVPINQLVDFHCSHPGNITVSSVPMYSQYGLLSLNASGQVEKLDEKPLLKDKWVNAGFMVFEHQVFERWEGENLEQEVLPKFVERGEVYSYRHEGFFKSLDSYKDQMEFGQLNASGHYPWSVTE